MASAKTVKKTPITQVMARMTIISAIEVQGDMRSALDREYDLCDFIEFKGSHDDSKIEIISITKDGGYLIE